MLSNVAHRVAGRTLLSSRRTTLWSYRPLVRFSNVATQSSNEAVNSHNNKTLKPVPGPPKWRSIQAILNKTLQTNMAAFMMDCRKKYGDVVKLWIGQDFYFIYDPELFLHVLRQEWLLPHGATPEAWPLATYYENRFPPDKQPMMLRKGEAWKVPRQTIQSHMLSPQAADTYQEGISEVVNDLAFQLRHVQNTPPDMSQFLHDASFEMLAQVLLGRRMGLIDNTSGDKERQFVSSAVEAFDAHSDLFLGPQIPKSLLKFHPAWNRFVEHMDQVWEIGMDMLEENEASLPPEALVAKLKHQGKMPKEERFVNVVTFLQGSVDNTSNSLLWILFHLAKQPNEQEQLRREVRNVLVNGNFQREFLPQLPYLKAFVREVHRVTPTISGNLRKLPFPVQVGDYEIPQDSKIVWDSINYSLDGTLLGDDDPKTFNPSRWLVDVPATADPRKPWQYVDKNGNPATAPAPILSHPILATPFGVGPRMCVASRVAQNEIHSVIAKLVCDFHLTLENGHQEFKVKYRSVKAPDPTPIIRFDPVD